MSSAKVTQTAGWVKSAAKDPQTPRSCRSHSGITGHLRVLASDEDANSFVSVTLSWKFWGLSLMLKFSNFNNSRKHSFSSFHWCTAAPKQVHWYFHSNKEFTQESYLDMSVGHKTFSWIRNSFLSPIVHSFYFACECESGGRHRELFIDHC